MSSDASNPNIRTSMGSASYAPEEDALIWKIKSFPGGKVLANFYFSIVCLFVMVLDFEEISM